MTLKVAIVGRPNVGKSTLFNRLVGRKQSLVDNRPGVTRDYREGRAQLWGRDVTLIDTAGLIKDHRPDAFSQAIREMTEKAVSLADLLLLIFDGRMGLNAADRDVADYLRRQDKPVLLAANKCEGKINESLLREAFELGFGEALRISAEHGEGMGDLAHAMTGVVETLASTAANSETKDGEESESEATILKIAVVGRPNSGKSSLINKILGTDRLLTGTTPGVTRDAISIHTRWVDKNVRIHDTAGMRKRAKISDKLEKLSVSDGLRAIRFAEVVIVVLDANIPFEAQDVRIADLAEREGRSVVFAANKWDLISDSRRHLNQLEMRLEDRLPNLRGAELVPVSAKDGYGLHRLNQAVGRSWKRWNGRVSTGQLNRWLEEMKTAHPPPAPRGRRIRLRYMTQVNSRPPSFVIMCSQSRRLPTEYIRYLKNGLREEFHFDGVPIRIMLRSQSDDNPYL